jgi:hypothetical protein
MRNLPAPSRASDRADLKTAVRLYLHSGQLLGHNITEDELELVLALYDRYELNRGASCFEFKGEGMADSLLETIHSAFRKTRKGRSLFSLRDMLFKGVDLCPVCGIREAEELDHFLPQSEFKPLSIYSRNLVPMCHPCNKAKSAGYNEDGFGFLHPYYDLLPDVDFLMPTVVLDGETLLVTFSVDPEAALPDGFAVRLAAQMEALKLEERYHQEVNSYVAGHAAAMHLAYIAEGQIGVKRTLRLQALFETQKFYRNHWRPVLLRALCEHHSFTDGGFGAVFPIDPKMLEDLGG